MAKSAVQAFEDYARLLEAALACVTRTHISRGRLVVNVSKPVTVQQGMARLNRTGDRLPIYFGFFHDLRITRDPAGRSRGPYLASVESWLYRILDGQRHDILLYHWAPNGSRPDPHLHVGSILLGSTGHELGKSFSKLHIVIGRLPLQRVVRMLIEEFDVEPLHNAWHDILTAPVETHL